MELLTTAMIEGYPATWHRAGSNNGRRFDPPANKAAKERIQWAMRWSGPPDRRPVQVQVVCEYTRPKPTADVDNLLKICLDALQDGGKGFVIADDRQVVSAVVTKQGGRPADRTTISVFAVGDEPW